MLSKCSLITVTVQEKVNKMNELVKKQDAIDALYCEQVSTNPEHFKSNEKFIKFMEDADIASFGNWQWANGFNTALIAASIRLEKLPSIQRWIPVTEKLPEEGRTVLGTFEFQGGKGCMTTERVIIKGKEVWSAACGMIPIAWMPLPEPWEGEENG